jgi:hypothetical protein
MSERDEILALVAALSAELQAERAEVAELKGQLRRATECIAELAGDFAEASAAAAVEPRRQLLTNEQFRRADAELARALGGQLVEVAPSPQPRPRSRQRLKLAIDSTTKPPTKGES